MMEMEVGVEYREVLTVTHFYLLTYLFIDGNKETLNGVLLYNSLLCPVNCIFGL